MSNAFKNLIRFAKTEPMTFIDMGDNNSSMRLESAGNKLYVRWYTNTRSAIDIQFNGEYIPLSDRERAKVVDVIVARSQQKTGAVVKKLDDLYKS